MRGLTGLTLVFAGVATAIYGFYPEPESRQAALDRLVGSVGATLFSDSVSDERTVVTDMPLVVVDPARRAFSPQAPLFQQVPSAAVPQAVARSNPVAASSMADAAVATAATLASQVLPGPAAAQTGQSASGNTADEAVTLSADTSAVTPPSNRQSTMLRPGLTSTKPGGEDAQRELARSLHRELKRVGCYDGDVNGSWSQSSRRAMKAFTERVNATLPVDEPDYILLTLVQGHGAEACGGNCPSDQILAKDGKCLPRAIVAQAANKNAKRSAVPKVAAAKPVAQPIPDAKVADVKTLAKTAQKSPEVGRALEMWAKVSPPAGATVDGGRTANTGGWQTATISAKPAPVIAPAAQPAPVAAPLPGRMAIGGPTSNAPASGPSVTAAPPVAVTSPASDEAQQASRKADRQRASGPEARRLPRHVVDNERPKPRRAKSYDTVSPAYAPQPVRNSKAARVRNMHYNLFNNPERVTN